MSLSKAAQNQSYNVMFCEICKKSKGIYSCPRCNRKYCSSQCYKSREHELCSESFYREWVESSLRNKTFDDAEKNKMAHILKKQEELAADADPCFAEQFAGLNIDDADETVLWQILSKEEKAEFKALIEDDKNLESVLIVKQPWWTVTVLNLVIDMDEKPNEKDYVSPRPNFPLNVRKLSDMTSKKPSTCLQFNMVNILYVYAFLCRFYNCDLRDFLDDVVDLFFILCPVLLEQKNYCSLEESVQDSIRLIINSELNVSLEFAKSIVSDVSSIMQGPSNARPSTFVLCALHDIELLFLEMKSILESRKNADKCSRKRLMPAVKKIEYFMSWSLNFESNFTDLASDLLLLMLPELFSETDGPRQEDITQNIVKSKPLIEEVD